MNKQAPCYQCQDRHFNCHSNCEAYCKFRKDLDARNIKQKQQKDQECSSFLFKKYKYTR